MKRKSIFYSLLLFLSAVIIATVACDKDTDTDDDKKPTDPNKPEVGTVADIQGRVYQTVKIGTQWWMSQNLNTTMYKNSQAVTNGNDASTWNSATEGLYCEFNGDSANAPKYGRLYNYNAAVNPAGICPAGWHLPTIEEWETMINHLGGILVAGGKLKAKGTEQWQAPNTDATNTSGFNALGSGFRVSDGTFEGLKKYSSFWTATPYDSLTVWNFTLAYSDGKVYKSNEEKPSGKCIRCVKD